MNANLQFDFVVHKERNTIEVKREFAAKLPVVWHAFTNGDILDQWWGPKPWKARTKKMDFRAGGTWFYAMVSPQGEEHWSLITYNTVDPQKSYTAIDGFTDAAGNLIPEMPRSNWKVHFSDKGDHTLVEFEMVFPTLQALETIIQMGFKEGLGMAMEGLDKLLPELKK